MRNLCQFSQSQLIEYINQVSFAVNDITLFLDSHPKNQKALAYFHEHSERRNEALKEYARRFGPLTIDTANDAASNSWEGGNCSCGTMRSDCNIR